jgi:hypothetical protein
MGMINVIKEDFKDRIGIGKAEAITVPAREVEEEDIRSPYDAPVGAPVKAGNGNGRSSLQESTPDPRGRNSAPQATMKVDPSVTWGVRSLLMILVNVIAIMFLASLVVASNPGALQLIVMLPAIGMVALFCFLFAFVWITRKVSIPYFSAWRKGWFLRVVFSGNDALFRPQEYGSGVIYSADGELKSYLKRGIDLFRAGSVDICPVVDECGLTGDPLMVAGLGVLHAKGLKTYAEVRKAYKEGVLRDDTPIEIPDPVVVPFRILKNFIMGAPTSSLLYAHTDYQAEKKYRLRSGLLGDKKGTVMTIFFVCLGIAIIIFAISMSGIIPGGT